MSRGNGAGGPEDIDATFAEIVADLRREGVGTAPEKSLPDDPVETAPVTSSATGGWRGSDSDWSATMFGDDPAEPGKPDDPDDHYVPPEPPPLPRPRKGAFVVLLFLVLGLLLLIAPSVIGLAAAIATPLGLLALAAGIALLLLRVKQGPPDGADPDNGAQV
ncbi:hypothetical protein [Amycolatopsis suaedae]|uniref:DUF308 domain-containing protein n=1 Tax=Amycolatopsis suaedae TaxID=2510978 RepID=A0A4Q7J7M8_9PSEU|nr:hypothetical protein [Amycolatopsis suaedae]RZQ63187.1 hypothetical protein EWH70_16040 [Amycolatopsis suaedae]